MRFTYSVGMPPADQYLPLASAAETAGFDTIAVADGIFFAREAVGAASMARDFLEQKAFLDPFSIIPAMATTTSTVRFLAAVVKLPVRHPVLVAKQASSVAVLAGERFSLGVGISPWPEDYRVCDVPWAGRGRRMDEGIEIVRGLMAGGYFEHHGTTYDIAAIKLEPTPKATVPIIVGGNSDAAMRRAARLGDGWISFAGDQAGAVHQIETIRAHQREFGTDERPFEVHMRVPGFETPEGVERLEALGVTDLVVRLHDSHAAGPDDQSLDARVDALGRFAEAVIAPLG